MVVYQVSLNGIPSVDATFKTSPISSTVVTDYQAKIYLQLKNWKHGYLALILLEIN
jgi:hypothetical protein